MFDHITTVEKANKFIKYYWHSEFEAAEFAPKVITFKVSSKGFYFITYDANEEEYILSLIDNDMCLSPVSLSEAGDFSSNVYAMIN